MRGVHRAISDLRRGTPVLIVQQEAALLVGTAETLGAAGLADIAAAGLAAPVLLLAPTRAAALLRRPRLNGMHRFGVRKWLFIESEYSRSQAQIDRRLRADNSTSTSVPGAGELGLRSAADVRSCLVEFVR